MRNICNCSAEIALDRRSVYFQRACPRLVQESSKEIIIGIILEIGFFPCEPSISAEFSEDMRPVVRLDLDEIPVIFHSV